MLIYKAEQKQYLNNADDLVKELVARGYRIDDCVIQAVKQQLEK